MPVMADRIRTCPVVSCLSLHGEESLHLEVPLYMILVVVC